MARLTFDEARKFNSGGGAFFNIKNGEEAMVRFLIDRFEELAPYTVHEFGGNGGNYATIDCGRQSAADPVDMCKWCAQGSRPVSRVIVPMYNIDAGQVQYWKKSQTWAEGELQPIVEEITKMGASIAGQVYKVKRQGEKLDTKYVLIPVGGPDGKTKNDFGEIKDGYELNMIKPTNTDFDPGAAPAQNAPVGQQPTRRTADVF